ncbi:MAG: hypothetical protein Q9170_008117, partial [Blastenia crenularia]
DDYPETVSRSSEAGTKLLTASVGFKYEDGVDIGTIPTGLEGLEEATNKKPMQAEVNENRGTSFLLHDAEVHTVSIFLV